jgi:hypothetical protein
MSEKRKNKNVSDTVISEKGIIVPAAWDDQGRPISLVFETDKETEYLIDTEDMTGRALFKFLRQKVKITGLPKRSAKNRKMITVQGFVVI